MTTAAVDTKVAVARLIEFLETGNVPHGLFAPDVFLDLSLPHWRLQADTAEEVARLLRLGVDGLLLRSGLRQATRMR